MSFRCLIKTGALLLCLLLLCVPITHAHRVIIFAWIEGETVHTVSKFPGGNRVVDSTVAVYDGQGDRLLEGNTDDQGNFSFPLPSKPSALKIVLEAGTGHQGEWILSEEEVRAALGGPHREETENRPTGSIPKKKEGAPPKPAAPHPEISAITAEQIETIVDRALDRKLQPMMNILADMHDPGPSLKDIFGGIGYILGLFGAAALVAARKRQT